MNNPEINSQIALMKQAIKINDDIDVIERLIKPVDPITAKVMKAGLKNQYIEVTQQLFHKFLNIVVL